MAVVGICWANGSRAGIVRKLMSAAEAIAGAEFVEDWPSLYASLEIDTTWL
jgi:hypothetical protein